MHIFQYLKTEIKTIPVSICEYGADNKDRTCNLTITSGLLYQLELCRHVLIIAQKGIDFHYSFGANFLKMPLFFNLGAIAIYIADEIITAKIAFVAVVIAFQEANAFAAFSGAPKINVV